MDPALLRLLAVAGGVALVAAVGWWWQRRTARLRTAEQGRFSPDELAGVGLRSAPGHTVGVLFGSPTCSPCTSVKRVLGEVARERPDFRWVELDAADHLELAARHHVLRVPTLFLLEPSGRILARTSGVPAARELTAVLDTGVPVGIPQ